VTPHNLTDGSVLQHYGWECFEQPSYCPDLASNDFCLFGALKDPLGGHKWQTNVEVQEAVSRWF